ncbi:copper chaperone [Rhodovulum sp. BSW8]|uniref:heavy-metal-associated domain-containing protein n=1 Tax=Rhodovulum sp. BSW8 TaxID=2259645 RepID=UPI000DE2486B|nr:heavy-metal-associated domain-containing protein [Rhodovulum sp. BSW8]RBO51559.1 copper chaperone [Rhodovulum sp. BSW8]
MNFSVPDMTCGHCTAAIEKAIRQRDPSAEISCDLGTHTVETKTALPEAEIAAAIEDAGYSAATV